MQWCKYANGWGGPTYYDQHLRACDLSTLIYGVSNEASYAVKKGSHFPTFIFNYQFSIINYPLPLPNALYFTL